jgi:competence protein ComEC
MKINLNRATFDELQGIIHIGPKRAQMIIAMRPFKDLYELSNVTGLGKFRMNDIIEQGLAATIV